MSNNMAVKIPNYINEYIKDKSEIYKYVIGNI